MLINGVPLRRGATLLPSRHLIRSKPASKWSLAPAAYTAILAGSNGGTGIGLVEIYNVQ